MGKNINTITVDPDVYTAAFHSEKKFCVKVPKSAAENRELKYGHVEDDNVAIAYLNFPVLRASLIFTIISLTSFTVAVIASFHSDYKPFTEEELLDNSLVVQYGGKPFRCKTLVKLPDGGLPSIINMLEINVWGNVIFRAATCLSIAVRVFHVMLFRSQLNLRWKDVPNPMFRWFSDLMPMITGIETIALAMFSIVTMHTDFKDLNHFCKSSFAVSATVNMILQTVFHFIVCMSTVNFVDIALVLIRGCCSGLFAFFAMSYFRFHIGWTKESLCHSYIPRDFALMEYIIILSYLIFHLLSLHQLRNLQFICFPRECSGECEPLNPQNFEKNGGKYEHCRAFEYNQRRLYNNHNNISLFIKM